MTSCLLDLARGPGTAITCLRIVAVVALAWKTDAMAPVARVRLNAIAASTSQAELAEEDPGGNWAGAPDFRSAWTCSSMTAWARWDFSAWSMVSRGVGEHAVVAVAGEQFALPVGDGRGVEPFDAAHDQPAGDVVGLAAGGERGEPDLGHLRVGDQPLLLFVPDRVGVVDRGPRRLVDA
jgi:hypothetical protein